MCDVQFFDRSGSPVSAIPSTINLSKGSAAYKHRPVCGRCGGAGGSEAWRHTGWTCYQCQGIGLLDARLDRCYTAEKLAALNAARDARNEKKRAAREAKAAAAARAAEEKLEQRLAADALLRDIKEMAESLNDGFIADLWEQVSKRDRELTDSQREAAERSIQRIRERRAERAAREALDQTAGFVGSEGERIEIDGTLEFVREYMATAFNGFTVERRAVIKIRQGSDVLVWFTKARGDMSEGKVGARVVGKATVKKHERRDDVPQTVITRAKLEVQ